MAKSVIKKSLARDLQSTTFSNFIAPTGTTNINLPNNYRGYFAITDSNSNRCGMYIVTTTSTGVLNLKAITTASDITITTSTNNIITLTTTSGNRSILFTNISGGIASKA